MSPSQNQAHFYMVTFDIIGSKGKEALYEKVRRALQTQVGDGNYYRLLKQCVLIETLTDRREVGKMTKSILGDSCNILIVRLQSGQAYRIVSPNDNLAAKKFFKRLKKSEESL